MQIGFFYNESGAFEPAISAFRTAINLDPQNSQGWIALGSTLMTKGYIQEGILALEEGVETSQNDLILRLNLAHAYLENSMYNQAIDQSQKCIGINENDPRGWISLGLTYLRQKRFEQVEQVFNQGISILPEIPEFYFYLGISFLSRSQFEPADSNFRKMLKLNPKDGRGWLNLSLVYLRQENYKMGIKVLREGL